MHVSLTPKQSFWSLRRIGRRVYALLFEYPITSVEMLLVLYGILFGFWVLAVDGRDAQFSEVAQRFPLMGSAQHIGAWLLFYNCLRLWAVTLDMPRLRGAMALLGALTWGILAGLYLAVNPTAHDLPGYLVAAMFNVWVFYRLALRAEMQREVHARHGDTE